MSKSHELIEEGRLMGRDSSEPNKKSVLERYQEDLEKERREIEARDAHSRSNGDLGGNRAIPESEQERRERETREIHGRAGEELRLKRLSQLGDKARNIVASDPQHKSLEGGYHQLSMSSIVDGETLDAQIILSGGVSPKAAKTVSVFVTGLKSRLKLDEGGGWTVSIGYDDFRQATMTDVSFYGKVVDGITNNCQ